MSDLPQDSLTRIEKELQRLKAHADNLGEELKRAQQELAHLEADLRKAHDDTIECEME